MFPFFPWHRHVKHRKRKKLPLHFCLNTNLEWHHVRKKLLLANTSFLFLRRVSLIMWQPGTCFWSILVRYFSFVLTLRICTHNQWKVKNRKERIIKRNRTKPTAICTSFCYQKRLRVIKGMWCITKGIFCHLKIPNSSNSSTARLLPLNLQFGQFVWGWNYFVLWHMEQMLPINTEKCRKQSFKNIRVWKHK